MVGLPLNQKFGEETGPDMGTFEAAYELAVMDTFVSGWARDTAISDMDGPDARKLSPEELNEKYPDVQKPFTQPMSEVAAFHLNEEAKKRNALQRKISEGPNGSVYTSLVGLGAGLVAHALDPVEFGAGALTGLGLSALGAQVAGRASVAGVAKAGQFLAQQGGGKAGSKFAFQAAEGMLGNAVVEPAMYQQSQRALVDYGIEDAMLSVVGGGLAAPVASFGIKKTWGGLFNKSDAASGLAAKTAIGQVQEGIRPDVELVNRSYDNYIFNEPSAGVQLGEVRSNYRFEPVDVSNIGERSFFVAGESHDRRVIGEYFGEGTYATDNPNFANNLAAHPMEEVAVNVREIRLKDANILDGNSHHKDLLIDMETTVKDNKLKKIISEAETIQDAWTNIRKKIDDGSIDDTHARMFLDEVKSRGYDGVAMTDKQRGHNTLHLFPEAESKISETGNFKPDRNAVPELDKAELNAAREKLRSPENQIGFDAEDFQATRDFILSDEFASNDFRELDLDTQTRLKNFEELAERGLLDADAKAELEAIRTSRQDDKSFTEAMSDFANCLLSGAN